MKRLKLKDERHEYWYDVERIVQACAEAGYDISPADAAAAWQRYSESMAAGWMCLHDDPSHTVDIVLRYAEVEEEEGDGHE